jgi:putative membrane protein
MNRSVLAGAVVLAMCAAPAFAQTTDTNKQKGTTQKSGTQKSATPAKAGSDQHFVMEAAKGGMAEVELGKLATQKATNDQVKQFGQRMVDDHGKANDELKSLAQNKKITLPTEVDPKDKAFHDRLAKMSGEQFDRAYMQHMLADHRKDVNAFRMESKSGKDPDVKAWASKTLPTLEEHLKQAQETNKAVGTSGTAQKGTKSTKGTKGTKTKQR